MCIRIEPLVGRGVAGMPRLEGCNADGFVEAQRTATGLFMFEENWLEQGVGSVEGCYRWVSPW